ncbi:MAG: tetrathionate reductase family octaheme c-type cytochrome [Bacteroidales bacterium]|nr:tetrathionate reductase family octaheme c-type cytochrome [Bacteroidales bacterium]MCF8391877.1 tetrathionate reductase family octaheme c-type cytochrome [Bacteroidales bacterium]
MLTVKESKKRFFKLLILFIAIITPWIIGVVYVNKDQPDEKEKTIKLINYKQDTLASVDHSKFAILQENFETPQQVTAACISCHNLTDKEVMATSHWKWSKEYIKDNGDTIQLGKKNIVNNFCIGVASNESRCTSCHIGYGYTDSHFDFADSSNIDCLVCHDLTGTYKKFPTDAGYPVVEEKTFEGKTFSPPNYGYIAQNVGAPSRQNCGSCHFVGGGGNNVKHGDIASELKNITKNVDVHMAVDGAKMGCIECHKTDRHNISGNLYSIASTNTNRVTCEQCHGETPHENGIINNHTKKIACQTCHIPIYAKESPTKMAWDWSKAGQFDEDGKPFSIKDSAGNTIFDSKKGSFIWENNVVPEYYWFNGEARHYVLGDTLDPGKPLDLNILLGSYDDTKSKIYPVKVHVAKQIYDPVNNMIILPHLYGNDSTSYWKNFDWDKASRTGMDSIGLPYSGKFDFIETKMYWPVNHMVAPGNEALQCTDCHSRNGRLQNLAGFYLPRRDFNGLLDKIGYGLLIASILGVSIHGLLRIRKV